MLPSSFQNHLDGLADAAYITGPNKKTKKGTSLILLLVVIHNLLAEAIETFHETPRIVNGKMTFPCRYD